MKQVNHQTNIYTDQDTFARNMAMDIATSIDPVSMNKLVQGGLTASQLKDVEKRIIKIAEETEKIFGKDVKFAETKVQDFVKSQFTNLVSSIIEVAENQPDLIREAGVSEAVFSFKGSLRPIISTYALATCIGVAGYDPMNAFGFVVHFSEEDEIKASGDFLMSRIHAYREKNANAPLLIHLRGGIKGMSELLLAKVKEWLSSKDIFTIIASEDTLQDPIAQGIGIPKVPASIKLDVRTGVCEAYDRSTNPFAERDTQQEKTVSQDTFENIMYQSLIRVITKKSEIKIVYDAKA